MIIATGYDTTINCVLLLC